MFERWPSKRITVQPPQPHTIHGRLKSDPSYTPAGLNTLDGAFAVFGYVVDGQDFLDELQEGDVIQSAKLVSGSEYLKQP